MLVIYTRTMHKRIFIFIIYLNEKYIFQKCLMKMLFCMNIMMSSKNILIKVIPAIYFIICIRSRIIYMLYIIFNLEKKKKNVRT